jgi:hypothetical protein
MARIRGSYPGGPRRGGDAPEPSGRPPRLESAEELDARRGRAASRRSAQRKRRRAWSILAAAIVLAGGAGLFLGFRSHRTSRQLTDEREAERQGELTNELNEETNRMLMELWRMEDVEFQRNRRGP